MGIFDDAEEILDGLGAKIKKKLKESKKTIKETRKIITNIDINDEDINMKNINIGIGNKSSNRITINGKSFDVQGNNVVVKNGKVIVGGKTIQEGLSGTIKVEFTGNLATLDCTTATINGNVRGGVNGNTINIQGNVDGDVNGTTINCGNVRGDVDGSTIKCGNVHGDVDGINVRRL